MSRWQDDATRVIPAHLEYITVYNPSLGTTDETRHDQILCFCSPKGPRKPRRDKTGSTSALRNENGDADVNEQLRQVGLAQGMVAFAGNFAGAQTVNTVETGQRRKVLLEIEPGWWILASVCLTRLPSTNLVGEGDDLAVTTTHSYTNREVSPGPLLSQQIRRASRMFLLHHGSSLDDVNSRTSRDRFRKMLDDFWTHFAENWDVLLHGNPIVDSYDGIKLAGGGELGVGVGEEDWGSGERAMLEGIIAGIDGLVDVVVSKYGESGSSFDNSGSDQSPRSWLGGMVHPGSDDGVLFRGIGALSSPTTRCIVDWMESIHFHGDDAYGLRDRSASRRHKRTERGTQIVEKMQQDPSTLEDSNGIENRTEELHLESPKASPVQVESADPKIPRPIVSVAEDALRETTASIDAHGGLQTDTKETISSPQMDTPIPWSKYLTLGYGSAWGSSSKKDVASNASPGPIAEDPKSISGQKSHKSQSSKIAQTPSASEKPHRTSSAGRFMIGLNGDLDASKEGLEQAPDDIPSMPENRVSFRTVYTPSVEAEGLANSTTASEDLSEHSSFGSQNGRNAHQDSTQQYSSRRFRVVVYAHQPFIFTFLFEPSASSLAMPSFYRTLHRHLDPLCKSMLGILSPERAVRRLNAAMPPLTSATLACSLYSLNYDPSTSTILSTIPNVPIPGGGRVLEDTSKPLSPPWSRAEGLHTHAQLLSTCSLSCKDSGERERQCKTGRGWWIVWMRVPNDKISPHDYERTLSDSPQCVTEQRQAILIRRTNMSLDGERGSPDATFRSTSGMSLSRLIGRETQGYSSTNSSSNPHSANMSEGIGIDARKYVEGLFAITR